MQRGQIVEADLLAQLVGIFEVDRLDAQQREVPLVFLGRPDLPGDDGTGLEPEPTNLAGGDVDVVGAGEVVVVRAAQEAKAVGQYLERSLPVHEAVLLDPLFQDLEDQVLLLEAHVLGDAFALGGANQLRHRHFLKLGEMDLASLDILVAIVERGIAEDVFLFLIGAGGQLAKRQLRRRRALGTRGRGIFAIPVAIAIPITIPDRRGHLATLR